ncbi:hypothetical protein C2G38_2202574 [Gigaspora rosea]|uniref:Uncharacterized protein n=1 Tax=Gigaspora rosea TaxID=44941 RepID=A0A397URD3_9GLOM|nr:hypothetical protein C2G38_2202574 [Gigaspora rosea]
MNDSYWGWIKLHRPSKSICLNSEIELLQQISNHISLAIFYKTLMEENFEKEIQLKAETIATKAKTQILANTSHVNEILNTAKLEIHQITSINTIFNLLDLFEKVIKQFIKDAKNKQIKLILNYDIENLPRYIKSNPER